VQAEKARRLGYMAPCDRKPGGRKEGDLVDLMTDFRRPSVPRNEFSARPLLSHVDHVGLYPFLSEESIYGIEVVVGHYEKEPP
jgi:hypothetical protein